MENLTGGTPPVRYLPCVVPCKLYFDEVSANLDSVTTDFIERTVLALVGKTVISVAHKMPEKLAELYDEVIRVGV